MIKKVMVFTIGFIVGLMFITLVSTAASAATPTEVRSISQVQQPCREAGHAGEQACVVVYKQFLANAPVLDTNMSLAVAKPLAGRVKSFSVIYLYQAKRWNKHDTTGLTVNRGREGMMTDLSANAPVKFWVTTRDGGRTWSKLTTTDMDSVIAF